jgi:hypothetical protein
MAILNYYKVFLFNKAGFLTLQCNNIRPTGSCIVKNVGWISVAPSTMIMLISLADGAALICPTHWWVYLALPILELNVNCLMISLAISWPVVINSRYTLITSGTGLYNPQKTYHSMF